MDAIGANGAGNLRCLETGASDSRNSQAQQRKTTQFNKYTARITLVSVLDILP